jgi:hypothetical protein
MIDLFSPPDSSVSALDRGDDGWSNCVHARAWHGRAGAKSPWRHRHAQTGDASAFDDAAPWLDLPAQLLCDFDVLDDLAMAVNALGVLGASSASRRRWSAIAVLRLAMQDDEQAQAVGVSC